MERWEKFWKNNRYGIVVSVLIAILSYGFALTSVSVGIDDTAFDVYFGMGYSIRMGRLFLAFLHKIFDIVEFTPFWLEFLAVLFLLIFSWKVVSILEEEFGEAFSLVFRWSLAGVFISYPLMNEIFIYSSMALSVGLGYCFSIAAIEKMRRYISEHRRKDLAAAIFCLACGISLYESFIAVFFTLAMVLIFLECYCKQVSVKHVVIKSLYAIAIGAMAIVLNKILSTIVIKLLNLETLDVVANKSVIWQTAGIGESVKSILKTIFYDQIVAGAEYLPILFWILSLILLGIVVLIRMVKDRNPSILVSMIGIGMAAEVIVFAQGQTYYRSCQAFGIIVALAAAILAELLWKRNLRRVTFLVVAIVVLMQSQDLSRWFYLDNQRAEAESNLVSSLVIDMKKEGLEDKRLLFVYEDKASSLDYYYSYNSISPYSIFRRLLNQAAQYNSFTGTPEFLYQMNRKHNQTNCAVPYIAYAVNGFEGDFIGPNYEMKEYLKSYFFNFQQVTWEEWEEGQKISEELDAYPSQNYYKEVGDYWIVKIGV